MPTVTIQNLSEEAHRALEARAARHGRGIEAEMREILESTARPAGRVRLGSALSALGRDAGLTDDDVALIRQVRDREPADPMIFE
ncbi:plasmid stabilization protein [uncultured Methylobacterium sp.]|jgi:plasmid stability protein|uniref:FitA-like ribbon-helix-helix domain-containing protein n=1 Tax=uncultured Methylobacterium sp. TaxID=157278 RepID=UPI0026218056|nr:plasmid stabilization protein [uncultured Methylobacterium sp.]